MRPRNSSASSGGLLAGVGNGDTQPNSPLSLQGSDESGPDIPADLPDYCKGAARGKVGSCCRDNCRQFLHTSTSRPAGCLLPAAGRQHRPVSYWISRGSDSHMRAYQDPFCQDGVSCSHLVGALFCCQAANTVAVCAMVLLSCLQKSMSGIELDETCVNLFMHMKTRSSVSSRGLREYTVPAKHAVPGWRAEAVCSTIVYMHHQQACVVLAVAAASIWYRLFELTARVAVEGKACQACFPRIQRHVV
jgi:hypothetical protein